MQGRDGRAWRAGVGLGIAIGVWAGGCPAGAAPGDLNANNAIDRDDAAIALRIAGGQAPGAGLVATGDVASPAGNTPDGRITLLDALRIARAAAGLDNLGGQTGSALAVAKQESVTIAGATTKNIQLPPGYRISGTLKDTKGQSVTSGSTFDSISGSIGFQSASNPAAFPYAAAAATTGAYSTVVAAGTNTATVSTSVSQFVFDPFTIVSYTLSQTPTPASVVVNGDTVQNFVRPDLPSTGTVAGSLTAPDSIEFGSVSTIFTNGSFAFTTMEGDSYSLVSPPGQGAISVAGSALDDENSRFTARFGNPGVTVTSGATTTRNLVVPALATLSGSATAPTGGAVVSVSMFTRVTDATSDGFDATYTIETPGTTSNYLLLIPPGTYDVIFNLSPLVSGQASTTFTYQQTYTVVAGDNEHDFTLPALPALVTLQGKITGPDGKAVSGASVAAALSQPGGFVTGWRASGSTTTDASGNYTLRLPAGTYLITAAPPNPS